MTVHTHTHPPPPPQMWTDTDTPHAHNCAPACVPSNTPLDMFLRPRNYTVSLHPISAPSYPHHIPAPPSLPTISAPPYPHCIPKSALQPCTPIPVPHIHTVSLHPQICTASLHPHPCTPISASLYLYCISAPHLCALIPTPHPCTPISASPYLHCISASPNLHCVPAPPSPHPHLYSPVSAPPITAHPSQMSRAGSGCLCCLALGGSQEGVGAQLWCYQQLPGSGSEWATFIPTLPQHPQHPILVDGTAPPRNFPCGKLAQLAPADPTSPLEPALLPLLGCVGVGCPEPRNRIRHYYRFVPLQQPSLHDLR